MLCSGLLYCSVLLATECTRNSLTHSQGLSHPLTSVGSLRSTTSDPPSCPPCRPATVTIQYSRCDYTPHAISPPPISHSPSNNPRAAHEPVLALSHARTVTEKYSMVKVVVWTLPPLLSYCMHIIQDVWYAHATRCFLPQYVEGHTLAFDLLAGEGCFSFTDFDRLHHHVVLVRRVVMSTSPFLADVQ